MTPKQRVQAIVEQITYKPEATFVVDGKQNSPTVEVRFTRPDAYGVKESATFSHKCTFTEDELKTMDDDAIVHRIFRTVRKLEIHETYEWFKFAGKRRITPHPGLTW